MQRAMIDRFADTTAFRLVLLFSGLIVTPVLTIGVFMTVIGGGSLLAASSTVDLEQATFALVSLAGVLGYVGYVRAHLGARNPGRHNVTATLLCLAAGVMAALGVAVFVAVGAMATWLAPWDRAVWAALFALFALASIVWALAGVAWMQRLLHRYAQSTGRVFDTLPVMLLFVALALATVATLATTAL